MQQTRSLEQIPEALRQKKNDTQYNVALWIFKYQKFNINAAMQHAPEGYSKQGNFISINRSKLEKLNKDRK